MTAPEFLPVLSAGAHDSPKDGACVMEYVSLLAGEEWSDSPACTHPVIAAVARCVNDRLSDSERQQLVPLIGRLFGTAPTGTYHEQKVLAVRLVVWSARQVLSKVREQDRQVCEVAISTAEDWCEGQATKQDCLTAYHNAHYAHNAAYPAYAVYAAAYATYAAYAYGPYAANNAVYAAENAVYATYATYTAYTAVSFLTDLIDEYDRLTGRTSVTDLTAEEYTALASAVTP